MSKIKGKPDVSKFLEGGGTSEIMSVPKKATKAVVATAPGAPKRQKLVELPEPIFEALKDRAYGDYKKTGRRVTETEIIIAALSQYLGVA
jgi:hypothetical protein